MPVVSILEWLFRMLLEVFKPEIQRELHTISPLPEFSDLVFESKGLISKYSGIRTYGCQGAI